MSLVCRGELRVALRLQSLKSLVREDLRGRVAMAVGCAVGRVLRGREHPVGVVSCASGHGARGCVDPCARLRLRRRLLRASVRVAPCR